MFDRQEWTQIRQSVGNGYSVTRIGVHICLHNEMQLGWTKSWAAPDKKTLCQSYIETFHEFHFVCRVPSATEKAIKDAELMIACKRSWFWCEKHNTERELKQQDHGMLAIHLKQWWLPLSFQDYLLHTRCFSQCRWQWTKPNAVEYSLPYCHQLECPHPCAHICTWSTAHSVLASPSSMEENMMSSTGKKISALANCWFNGSQLQCHATINARTLVWHFRYSRPQMARIKAFLFVLFCTSQGQRQPRQMQR